MPTSSAFALRLLISLAAAQELPSFTLTMRDGRLMPPSLEVPAHTRFKLVIRNEGNGPAEFESRALRKEKVLAPGASSFVIVAPLRPGVYDMFDEFHEQTATGTIVAR